MKINVYLERTNEKKSVQATTISEVLKKLKLNTTTVLIVRKGVLITEQATLKNNDTLEILSVISGG